MPITPKDALERSEVAALQLEEDAAVAGYAASIDAFLSEHWEGRKAAMKIPPTSVRVIAHLIRDFTVAGWDVTAEALDGVTGKAHDLLTAGAPVAYQLVLTPRWA